MTNIKELVLYKLIKQLPDNELEYLYNQLLRQDKEITDSMCDMKDGRMYIKTFDNEHQQWSYDLHKTEICEQLAGAAS